MTKLKHNKSLKIAKSILGFGIIPFSLISTISLSMTGCKKKHKVNVGNIDGTNWTGRNAGSFEEDDYTIDHKHKIVTYKSAISIHAYNLVLPNYVLVNDEQYRVDIGESCFANTQGIAGTIELNDFILIIPNRCFFNCTSLTGVVFHAYPIQIGVAAFANCFLLTLVLVLHDMQLYHDWGAQLISIGDYAFFNATLDGTLTFGPSLAYVGQSAFENCPGIKSADFRLCNNLLGTSVSEFAACTSLESVYFSSTMNVIDNQTFSNCDFLKTIYLPQDNMDIAIKDGAFYGCVTFQNFSKIPHFTEIGASAFTATGNIEFFPWEPQYKLDSIHPHTFSSCQFTSLKFWLNGPNIEDYAFANNFNLSVLDFTDFVIKKPEEGKKIGEVQVPDWDGQHIFSGANSKGGVILLPTNGVLDNGWRDFFARNDIELSSEPTKPEPSSNGWRIQFGAPRVEYVNESPIKQVEINVGEQTTVTHTFEGFECQTIGDITEEEIHDPHKFRVFYTPHIQKPESSITKPDYPIQTEILWKSKNKFDLTIKMVVSSLSESQTISGPISFFYGSNHVKSLGSNYTFKLIK